MKTDEYIKIHIDENCIVGWATRYYRENPEVTKSGFLGDETGKTQIVGEIRKPIKFTKYIYPYTKKSNKKFQYLMDKLNDDIQKKNLGAFYTPALYAKKSIELVRRAISNVPDGNDYIIIDRCAGTGNLELLLSDEELSHCIVSTYEYYEYKVLQELLGDKVRHIIPPTEEKETFNNGIVRGADALSEEFVKIDIVQKYLTDENCTIILFENPPYAETTSIEHQKKGVGKESSSWKNSFVVTEMKKDLKGKVKGAVSNDLANAFIWSAFKYYLRQDTDSYIVFSPVKYWKAQHLIDKEFLDGFAFNRKHFHTNIQACIMCALWSNRDAMLNSFSLKAIDIVNDETVQYKKKLKIKRINSKFSEKYFDKRAFTDDEIGIVVGLNGVERETTKRLKPIYNENILGYMAVYSSGFDNPDLHASLLSAGRYDGNGFYLQRDNFLEKLPMFASSRYITYNREWTERARIMKSGDGSSKFNKDVKNGKLEQFLLKCLLFTTLETQNHMRTFTGSDGRNYVNQLCLDDTHGGTLAIDTLIGLQLNSHEERLITQWKSILANARKTELYNKDLTYGVYQIAYELNTKEKDERGNTIYHYPNLNGQLKALKVMISEYYNTELVDTLFKYEFLK